MPIVKSNLLNIKLAAKLLKNDQVVAIPTETVYGLAGNACSKEAIKKIYSIKQRASFNPLIIHFRSLMEVMKYFKLNKTEILLATTFWPGPLTMILNNEKLPASKLSNTAQGKVNSFAVRVPDNKTFSQVLEYSNIPLAAPSANLSNKLSPTLASHVNLSLCKKDLLILDNKEASIGLESTIIKVVDPNWVNILRHGGISSEQLALLNISVSNHNSKVINAPGLLNKHYSPYLPIRINISDIQPTEALLGFGHIPKNLKRGAVILNLSTSGSLKEAAKNLFSMLWELDSNPNLRQYIGIAVMKIPNQGIGVAINERLQKASYEK